MNLGSVLSVAPIGGKTEAVFGSAKVSHLKGEAGALRVFYKNIGSLRERNIQ
jgi:hypothetical protein